MAQRLMVRFYHSLPHATYTERKTRSLLIEPYSLLVDEHHRSAFRLVLSETRVGLPRRI